MWGYKQLISVVLSITLVSGSILPNFAFGDEVASEPAGQDEQGTLQVPAAEGQAAQEVALEALDTADSGAVLDSGGVGYTESLSSDLDSVAVASGDYGIALAATDSSLLQEIATYTGSNNGMYSYLQLVFGTYNRTTGVFANAATNSIYFYISGIYTGIGNLNSKLTTVNSNLSTINTNIGTAITWLQNIYTGQGSIYSALSYTGTYGDTFSVGYLLYWIYKSVSEDVVPSVDSIADALSYTGTYGDTFSVGYLLYWTYKLLSEDVVPSLDSVYLSLSEDIFPVVDSISDALSWPDSSGNPRTIGELLYLVYKDFGSYLQYTGTYGDTFSVGYLLYWIYKSVSEDVVSSLDGVLEWLNQFVYTADDGTVLSVPDTLYRIMSALEAMQEGGASVDGSIDYSDKLDGIQDTLTGILAGVAILDAYVIWDDVTDEFDEATDEGAQNFSALTSGLRDLGLVLQRAFPFSLIFDFAFLIGLFIAPAQAPSFTIEFPNGVGGSVPYEIDLSEYEPVAAGFRTLMSISYGLALIFLTRKFIWRSGGEN